MVTDETRARARTELADLLPLARRKAEELPVKPLATDSPVGGTILPYMRVENVVGIHIYALFGGWYADLLLDPTKLPPASPDAVGTPMQSPHKTREEAEEYAVTTLALVIHNSRKPMRQVADDGKRYFGFFGLWLVIPAEVYGVLDKLVSVTNFDPADDPQHWLARLDEVKRKAFGDAEVTGEAFDALPSKVKREIFVLCVIAWSRLGLLRYPNEPDIEGT